MMAGRIEERGCFIDGLRLDHGPVAEIGRFLLTAESMVKAQGIKLSFGRISDLVEVQESNVGSWPILAPCLDARYARLDDTNSYCLLGRDDAGRIVATQAGRIYDLGKRSLQHVIDDFSLIYEPARKPLPLEPWYSLTAPSACKLTGTLIYSGALWVAPEFRGHRLAAVLPRISRAYALGHWNTDVTFTFIRDPSPTHPLFTMYGYRCLEPGLIIYNDGKMLCDASLTWMPRDELIDDMCAATSRFATQIDRAVGTRRGNNELGASL